jgi:predicted nucleic acid-binding protein
MTLVDTNVLIRLANTSDPSYPVAFAAIHALKAQGDDLRIVPQSLYEFWVVATRPTANNGLGLTTAACGTEIDQLEAAFPVLHDLPGLVAEWKALVVAHDCKGKVAHDARIVAAMRTHGLTRILTFNGADFHRYPGLTVLDPAAVPAASSTPPATP